MAGTPDLFDSEKGILEYEALAARALPPSGNVPNPAALVVDLAQYPIGRDALLDIGRRIATIYSLARGNQDALVNDRALAELFDRMSHSNQVASVRLWVRSVVEALDVARTAAQGPAVA